MQARCSDLSSRARNRSGRENPSGKLPNKFWPLIFITILLFFFFFLSEGLRSHFSSLLRQEDSLAAFLPSLHGRRRTLPIATTSLLLLCQSPSFSADRPRPCRDGFLPGSFLCRRPLPPTPLLLRIPSSPLASSPILRRRLHPLPPLPFSFSTPPSTTYSVAAFSFSAALRRPCFHRRPFSSDKPRDPLSFLFHRRPSSSSAPPPVPPRLPWRHDNAPFSFLLLMPTWSSHPSFPFKASRLSAASFFLHCYCRRGLELKMGAGRWEEESVSSSSLIGQALAGES